MRGGGGGDGDGGSGGGMVAMVLMASVRLSLSSVTFSFSGSVSHCTSECVGCGDTSWASWAETEFCLNERARRVAESFRDHLFHSV